jgi:hypothetical protein
VPEILELWVLKEFTKVREREKQRFIRTLLKGKKKKKGGQLARSIPAGTGLSVGSIPWVRLLWVDCLLFVGLSD